MSSSLIVVGGEKPPHIIDTDGTPQVLVDLVERPDANVTCTFGHNRQSAMYSAWTVWFMPLGCLAINEDIGDSPVLTGIKDFKVQALCAHHTDRQEPIFDTGKLSSDESAGALVPGHLARGSHLLVDLTVGDESNFPVDSWADSGTHWSDTAGPNNGPLPPALQLGYDIDTLRAFARDSDLGRLVFSGYAQLLK